MLKRLFSIITISLVITGSFFSAYNIKYPAYADSTTDGWTQVTTNEELADAFRYYCKSRDLTIDGSIADGVTKFTTSTFNGLCRTLGIDMTALQAKIKYQTDGNLGLRYLFDSEGISAYNRIFAQFLQDNNLQVGDSYNNQVIYSNDLIRLDNGKSCFIWHIKSGGAYDRNIADINKYGSYLDRYSDFYNLADNGYTVKYYINGNQISNDYYCTIYKGNNGNIGEYTNISYLTYNDIYWWGYSPSIPGVDAGFIVWTNSDNPGSYYIGWIAIGTGWKNVNPNAFKIVGSGITIPNDKKEECNITVNTVNVINNNVYEGDTIINNNGTTGDDDNPSNPDNPDIPDPNPGPTPDPPTIPDSGGWQDFSLPEMPNDWLIYGMEKKFPFDIPFNIMFALSLLNHEPEIPKFEGDLDLQVCTWHYDIDLTPFDDIATILRRFEVLAFIIGLAILTKELINWG